MTQTVCTHASIFAAHADLGLQHHFSVRNVFRVILSHVFPFCCLPVSWGSWGRFLMKYLKCAPPIHKTCQKQKEHRQACNPRVGGQCEFSADINYEPRA